MIIMFGVAAAADYSGMVSKKADLRDQVDNATLSAAVKKADNQLNPDFNLEQAVEDALVANGYDLAIGSRTVTEDQGILTVAVNVPHKLTFGKLLGSPTKNIKIDSTVDANGGEKYEIALVLDNTRSMGYDGRIGALKTSGVEFIRTIRDTNSGTRIALVPFARYVNVGIHNRNEPWIDVPEEYSTEKTWQQATHSCESTTYEPTTLTRDGVEYTYDKEVCHGRTTTYETQSETVESTFEGCVGVRENGLHLVDGSYTLERVPGLLNTEPHEHTGHNIDIDTYCPRPIIPLTDNYERLEDQMVKVFPTDSTYIPLGLSWAYRVLSPGEPYADYNPSEGAQRIVVLMSDGENTVAVDDSPASENKYENPPYLKKLEDDEVATQANADTLIMCNLLKSEGIKIYTIAFQVRDELTKEILQSCASSSAGFYDADSGESLSRSFKSISGKMKSELRIVR